MNQPARFHIFTLGCKINQYESQSIREAWLARGCEEADDPALADVIVVNSCAVTNKAVADLRAAVRRFGRQNPDAEVVITGCAAQVLAKELAETFPDTAIVPQSEKDSLLIRPPQALAPLPMAEPGDADEADDSDQHGCDHFPEFSINGSNRVRAVVKVQDGCTHRCTYCIIPSTRGRAISRPPAEAIDEVRRLFTAGWREVTLSGINLRQFGGDLDPAMDFWDLIARMDAELADEWAGRARLRVSSVDPGQLGPKALDTLAASKLICPQLHLSLQSLAPAVLRRMGRGHYGPDEILDFTAKLGGIWPVFGLGADLLVGFPGETGEDFALTLQYCEKLPLSYAHVFPYSRRPGTPAAKYPDQVPHHLKKARAKALRTLAAAKKAGFMERLAQLDRLDVVAEGREKPHGVCEYYADCRFTDGASPEPGRLTPARPVGWDKNGVDVERIAG